MKRIGLVFISLLASTPVGAVEAKAPSTLEVFGEDGATLATTRRLS